MSRPLDGLTVHEKAYLDLAKGSNPEASPEELEILLALYRDGGDGDLQTQMGMAELLA